MGEGERATEEQLIRTRTGTPDGQRELRCAVIEPDPSVRDVLSMMLSELNIQSREFIYSPDLYDSIVASPPDLIILDISIQEPQCWALMEQLQRGARTRSIPVLCTSTLADTLAQAKCRHQFPGGVVLLEKPFDIIDVERAVQTLVNV